MFNFSKIYDFFKSSRMQELHIRFIDNDNFYVESLVDDTKTYTFEENPQRFTLDEDGGLPNELFYYLVNQTNIPLEKLQLHIFEV